MKRSPDFLLREVAGTKVIVPVGAAASKFPGMLTVNDTGCWLWELLEQEQTVESLADAMTERYEVTRDQALADVKKFLEPLTAVGAVE